MYFTYLFRELRRRHRQAMLVSLGLALGVALVSVVSATSLGVKEAQGEVLHGLYGIGTDITVTKDAEADSQGSLRIGMAAQTDGESLVGEAFSQDRLVPTPGWDLVSDERVPALGDLDGVSSSAGGLMLTSLRITGTYTESTFSGGDGSGSGSGSGAISGSSTPPPIDVTSYSIAGGIGGWRAARLSPAVALRRVD